jgi:hypothetical protein
MKKIARLAVAVSVIFAAACPSVHAGVVFTSLGNSQYGVKLDPITFTLSFTESNANRVVIEDFFTTNATGSGRYISGNMNWQLNGGETKVFSFETNSGNFPLTSGQIDPNDLLFGYTIAYAAARMPALNRGDKITVWTNDLIFQTPGTRIAAAGPFTAYLLNNTYPIATATVSAESEPVPAPPAPNVNAVPEPASLGLLGLGLAALIASRRRNRA